MKDKILTIIQNNSEDLAADELTALMCYREVRAYCKGRSVFSKVPNLIVALFKDSYSKEDILKAVEQLKKETT